MADIDTEGGEGLERYPVIINGVETMLKLTRARAKAMGLTQTKTRTLGAAVVPEDDEAAAALVEPTAQHKKRGVASA